MKPELCCRCPGERAEGGRPVWSPALLLLRWQDTLPSPLFKHAFAAEELLEMLWQISTCSCYFQLMDSSHPRANTAHPLSSYCILLAYWSRHYYIIYTPFMLSRHSSQLPADWDHWLSSHNSATKEKQSVLGFNIGPGLVTGSTHACWALRPVCCLSALFRLRLQNVTSMETVACSKATKLVLRPIRLS